METGLALLAGGNHAVERKKRKKGSLGVKKITQAI